MLFCVEIMGRRVGGDYWAFSMALLIGCFVHIWTCMLEFSHWVVWLCYHFVCTYYCTFLHGLDALHSV